MTTTARTSSWRDGKDRPPLCANCDKGIKSCAPCCRHSGWVHRADNGHLCDPHDPTGKIAMPYARSTELVFFP